MSKRIDTKAINRLLARTMRKCKLPVRVTETTGLFEKNVLDSFSMIELASALEETFGVPLNKTDVNHRNFSTLQSIARLMDRKQKVFS